MSSDRNWDEDEHTSKFMRKAKESPFVPIGKEVYNNTTYTTKFVFVKNVLKCCLCVPVATLVEQVVDHHGFDYHGAHMKLMKMLAYLYCELLWIKEPAKMNKYIMCNVFQVWLDVLQLWHLGFISLNRVETLRCLST